MNITWAIIFLAVGLILLWRTAELLVSGAVALAEKLGITPLIIGLTVVAMGTSAPEVAASIAAAARDAGNMAIGNVYGSNIANLALVGGLCAIIRPTRIPRRMLTREMPIMLLVAIALLPLLYNLHFSRPEALILLIVFAAMIILTVYLAKKDVQPPTSDTASHSLSTSKSVLFIVLGLAGLALGADITIRGAVFIGQRIGLSETVIGLTIIAIGTSLPELVTCLVAAVKGHHDLAIGNLVGSNIFNTLLVTGIAGMVKPFDVEPRLIGIDYWVMIAVTAAFIIMAAIGKRISKTNGLILTTAYFAYMIYLLTGSG